MGEVILKHFSKNTYEMLWRVCANNMVGSHAIDRYSTYYKGGCHRHSHKIAIGIPKFTNNKIH